MSDAQYLAGTFFIDTDHPDVRAHAQALVADISMEDAAARAVAIFYAVRDGITYDPYVAGLDREGLKASAVLEAERGFCVNKAVLLCALARAAGVPCRLRFADVKNHLASPRLLALMRTDVFAFHGFNELFLGGRWVKATAAFDRRLCARFDVAPLEFDGQHDAELQPFNAKGDAYMAYLHDYGSYADLPAEEMLAAFRRHYPHMFSDRKAESGNPND